MKKKNIPYYGRHDDFYIDGLRKQYRTGQCSAEYRTKQHSAGGGEPDGDSGGQSGSAGRIRNGRTQRTEQLPGSVFFADRKYRNNCRHDC